MPADTTRGQKIKHTLKFAEQRRTLWLNTNNKDDYGRHRGVVLYGMNVVVTGGKTLQVAPGAVYTPYGTRLFFEQYQSAEKPNFNIVDLSQPIDAFNAPSSPVVVCVFLKFVVDDVTQMTPVDSISEFDTSKIEFGWRFVPYDRQGVHPASNLSPRDPVLLDRVQSQASEYELGCELDVRDASVTFHDPVNKETSALQFGEIPLAYVIIGANPETNALPVDLTSPGVDIVQCKNLFSTMGDLLGQDVFFGRHGRRVTAGLTNPSGSALNQGFTTRAVGPNVSPDLMAPKYGTGEPDPAKVTPAPSDPTGERFKSDQDKDSWNDAAWDTYRQPSLLRDGDGVIWALRRLDVILRQWMNRTGDQSLVATIQDGQGTGTHVRPMMTLDAILQHFKGNASPSTNLNKIDYVDGAANPGDNPANHVVKSGLAAHVPQSLDEALVTAYGDSHLNAISALDLGVWHVLSDLFGRDFARRALRRVGTWRAAGLPDGGSLGGDLASMTVALGHDDGPTGRLTEPDVGGDGYQRPDNKPICTGAIQDAYLAFEAMYDALKVLADRAQAAPMNWLRNANFVAGASAASPTPPLGWTLTGGTWTRVAAVANLEMVAANVIIGPGAGIFSQELDFQGQILNEILATCNIMHAAVCMKVISGTVRYGIRGKSAADAVVFDAHRENIGVSTTEDNYSIALRLVTPLPTPVTKLEFYIDATAPAEIRVLGASIGPGVPASSVAFNRNFFEFLSRDGGLSSVMRGPLEMGDNDIKNAHHGTFNGDLDVGGDAVVAGAETVGGLLTAESGADVNNEKIVNLQRGDAPTDAVNVEQLKERVETTPDLFQVHVYNRNRLNPSKPFVVTNVLNAPIGYALRVLVGATDEIRFVPSGPTSSFSLCSCECQCQCQCECQCQCQCNGRCNDRRVTS